MPTYTRFFAARFKGEYAGNDEESRAIREECYRKSAALYEALPYVKKYQGIMGGQYLWPDLLNTYGFHFAFITEFESEEIMVHFDTREPLHLDLMKFTEPYIAEKFGYDFPSSFETFTSGHGSQGGGDLSTKGDA